MLVSGKQARLHRHRRRHKPTARHHHHPHASPSSTILTLLVPVCTMPGKLTAPWCGGFEHGTAGQWLSCWQHRRRWTLPTPQQCAPCRSGTMP